MLKQKSVTQTNAPAMKKFEDRESLTLENQGQKIFAIFHRPIVQKKTPAVLICHGLAGHKTGRYRLYVALSERLAQAGIASLRFDFRGSGDSEGQFAEITLEDQISDAQVALNYLMQAPSIDKKRIGLFGRSVGGVVAIIAAGRSSGVKSLGVWAPLFDGRQWKSNWELVKNNSVTAAQAEELMRVNGQTSNKAFLHQLFSVQMNKELDPIKNVPFLHLHGEKDLVVDITHAGDYKVGRKDAFAKSQFILLPNSDHDFSYVPEQKLAIEDTVNWFKETL